MFKFIGVGSAFNTSLGNNNAYIKKEDSLLLVDCGGMTFHKIQEKNLLEEIKSVKVLITHTHPDHIGSLGDLIFYCFYILGIKPTIYFPQKSLLKGILDGFGVDPSIYVLIGEKKLTIKDGPFKDYRVDFKPTLHVDNLPTYGFYLCDTTECIYYSGDSYLLEDEVVDALKADKIQRLYHDTSGLDHENNRHYPFSKLKEKIPVELRSKVYCMHFDKHADFKEITENGFNIVEIEK